MFIERKDAVRRLKVALKRKTGKSWSVHGATGTAWGWITVEAPKKRRVSHKVNPNYVDHWETPNEPHAFEYVKENGTNYYTSREDCEILAEIFGKANPLVCHQGLSISPDSREHYVALAEA